MWFWFIPKMASTASSSTAALVAAGSLLAQPATQWMPVFTQLWMNLT
jgi:hypothetical protein